MGKWITGELMDYILKDDYTTKGELTELVEGEKMFISIGTPPCFKARFGSDRYGPEAVEKITKCGKSLMGTTITCKPTGDKYKVIGTNIMRGSVGYIGSLMLWVKKEN